MCTSAPLERKLQIIFLETEGTIANSQADGASTKTIFFFEIFVVK